jgi:hypothetical protein
MSKLSPILLTTSAENTVSVDQQRTGKDGMTEIATMEYLSEIPLEYLEVAGATDRHTQPYSKGITPGLVHGAMAQLSQQASVHNGENDSETQVNEHNDEDPTKDFSGRSIAAALALLLLVAILILQLIALAHAQSGLKVPDLQVRWCSPFFQPQAHAVLDNCNISPVVASQSQGIGCIKLPATQQKTWLLITTIILWLTLFCQLADFCFLFFNDKKSKGCHEAVKLQRPWLTMFFGMLILVILATKGTEYANHLPDGISERVLVFRYDPSLVTHSVCEAHLKSPGLRGGIIGYCDGLFSSWNDWYLGKNTRMGLSQ